MDWYQKGVGVRLTKEFFGLTKALINIHAFNLLH